MIAVTRTLIASNRGSLLAHPDLLNDEFLLPTPARASPRSPPGKSSQFRRHQEAPAPSRELSILMLSISVTPPFRGTPSAPSGI